MLVHTRQTRLLLQPAGLAVHVCKYKYSPKSVMRAEAESRPEELDRDHGLLLHKMHFGLIYAVIQCLRSPSLSTEVEGPTHRFNPQFSRFASTGHAVPARCTLRVEPTRGLAPMRHSDK
jgi:hypothetical protein